MTVGKRVRGSLYLHRDAIASLPQREVSRVSAASKQCDFDWNVVRVSADGLSFLKYRDFEIDPFPSLEASFSIREGEATAAKRDFSSRKNPPILHRKELLVSIEHPNRAKWEAVTRRLVACGAFDNAHLIGTRSAWIARLAKLGLKPEDYAHD